MSAKKVRWIILITNGLFLFTDQILKWQALHNWTQPHLISPYFGWQLFLNKGVAFGLPLSNSLTIMITLPMVGLIGYLFWSARGGSAHPPLAGCSGKDSFSPNIFLAWTMVLVGAVSNLLDRIIYHQVIDYFLIGTALINLSDILIVGGLLIYLWNVNCHSDRSGGIPYTMNQ